MSLKQANRVNGKYTLGQKLAAITQLIGPRFES